MALTNSKDITLTANAQTVGGLVSYQFFQGTAREVNHRPLTGDHVSLPSTPDYGRCQLNIYFDANDAGQTQIRNTLKNKTLIEFVLTNAGTVERFMGYCIIFPKNGTKQQTGETTVLSPVQIRVSGSIT